MSAVHSSEVVQVIQSTLAAPVAMPVHKPVVVRPVEFTVRVSPAVLAMLTAPVAVVMTILVAGALASAMNLPLHVKEMIVGGMVNIAGGVMAAMPLVMLLRLGTTALAQGAVLGIAIRMAIGLTYRPDEIYTIAPL